MTTSDEAAFPHVDVSSSTGTASPQDKETTRANAIPIEKVAEWLGLMPEGALRCPAEVDGDARGPHTGVHFHLNGVKCPHDRCEGKGNGRGFRSCVALVSEVREVTETDAARLLLEKFDPPPKIELQQLIDYSRSLRRKTDNRLATLGTQLLQICKGAHVEPAAVERVATLVGERFHDCNSQALADHFCASTGAESVNRIADLIEAAQRERLASKVTSTDLIMGENGPKANLANTLSVLTQHAAWSGVLQFDEFADRVVKLKAPPIRRGDGSAEAGDWTQTDSTRAIAWFASAVGFEPPLKHFEAALEAAAKTNPIHPVREYLESLRWDEAPRLDTLFPRYFGTADTLYTRFIGSRWMISAVARVMDPGCKVDTLVVLESPQGWRKSSSLRELVPDPSWFSDSRIPIGNKDAYIVLLRKWILEVPELDSFRNVERTKIKSFVSSQSDNYRAPYARTNEDHARQCAFAATTNEREYLDDHENRRYWPAKCVTPADLGGIRRDRDQLWAEALSRYHAGEAWWPDTPELEAMCRGEQDHRKMSDSWAETVETWLRVRPTNSSDSRRQVSSKGISTAEIQRGALNLKARDMSRGTDTRVGQIMHSLGWTRHGRKRHYFPPPDWMVDDPEPDARILANVIGERPGVPDQQLTHLVAAQTGLEWDRARLDRAIDYLVNEGIRQAGGGALKLDPRTCAEQVWALRFVSQEELAKAQIGKLFSIGGQTL